MLYGIKRLFVCDGCKERHHLTDLEFQQRNWSIWYHGSDDDGEQIKTIYCPKCKAEMQEEWKKGGA